MASVTTVLRRESIEFGKVKLLFAHAPVDSVSEIIKDTLSWDIPTRMHLYYFAIRSYLKYLSGPHNASD